MRRNILRKLKIINENVISLWKKIPLAAKSAYLFIFINMIVVTVNSASFKHRIINHFSGILHLDVNNLLFYTNIFFWVGSVSCIIIAFYYTLKLFKKSFKLQLFTFILLLFLVITTFSNIYQKTYGCGHNIGGVCDTNKFENCDLISKYGNTLLFYDEDENIIPLCPGKFLNVNDITFDYRLDKQTSRYFSAMTLFGSGYGEIYPLGKMRYIAIIEIFIGHFIVLSLIGSIIIKGFNF